jgi:hypothetical protein
MLIANPIYDTVFKFLMEDTLVAKRLISNIIGEEVVELEVKPQEHTTSSVRYFLTVFRVDFKAVIRTKTGELKKVLIELQKSKNAFDILRFRHYLGVNYTKPDEVDGLKMPLPILPIYLLGFKLSINRAVLNIGRQYKDVSTGEILNTKDDFIENLSHDCFVVQIPHLPLVTQTKLERVLSIFNQKWVFDEEQKWLLKYMGNIDDDDDIRLMVNRLALAAESEEVKEQIEMEDNFDTEMDNALRVKELIIEAREKEIDRLQEVADVHKRKADEAKLKAEEEKRKADERKRKADEEKRKADEENESLKQQLAEMKRRLDDFNKI